MDAFSPLTGKNFQYQLRVAISLIMGACLSASRNEPSQNDVADYISVMASELSEMSEAAEMNGLATILYAAHLEAKRVASRLREPADMKLTGRSRARQSRR
jgi:hypothetical protein